MIIFNEIKHRLKQGIICTLFYPLRNLTPFLAYAAKIVLQRNKGILPLKYWYVSLYYRFVKA